MDHPVRPSRSLKGRVAIVTGAGALDDGIGNGRAAAILLADDGAAVICVDMAKEAVTKTVEMIEKDGKGVAIAALADVTKEEDCRRVAEMALEKYGRVDILVNNVGVSGPKGTAVEVDMAEWAKGMEINVASMVMMAKCAIPAMLKNESDGYWKGSIVNLGSVAGLTGGTPNLLYPTTKGAVINMTRAMAAHHGKDGIRVNCVCPGRLCRNEH
jgi:NAD(P)-dependent dehydrogenase (short-subunit alcohol dehydrogenase family)